MPIIMSVTTVDRPLCSAAAVPPRKVRRVSFNSTTDVRFVTHKYPSDYFYTRAEVDRFRQERREERLGSAVSPVQRAFEFASSSVFLVILLIIGLVTATIACLPILMVLKIASIPFSWSSQDDVDSSVYSYSPSTDIDASSLTERLLISLLGGDGSLTCVKQTC